MEPGHRDGLLDQQDGEHHGQYISLVEYLTDDAIAKLYI